MRVAVYTITKNEEQFIERWADSCKEADYRLIVDTGSTDNTVAIAELAGCHVAHINVNPWRFDDARNASLMLIPADIDYCIALDADEVLVPGWRQELEKVVEGTTRPRYKYVWSWNPDGSEGLTYSGDKIHARHGYRWTHPVHEVLTPTIPEVQNWVNLQIHHHPDSSKSRSQYLPLLELAVRERPDDDRNRFYLGRELMFNGRNDEAKVHFERHLELSSWAPERSACMRYLAAVTGEGERWLLRACAEAPDRREPWVALSKFYYEKQKWDSCLAAAKRALEIKVKPLEYLCEADAWGALPSDLAGIASWNTGDKQSAISYGEDAVAIEPTNERLLNNLRFYYSDARKTGVVAVIPTKSNFDGLVRVVNQLLADSSVQKIFIAAHGGMAFNFVRGRFAGFLGGRIDLRLADDEVGIHHMWNMGLEVARNLGAHCFLVNDDVSLGDLTASSLAGFLDADDGFGLVCPNYDNRIIIGSASEVSVTCRGRYDGSGGMAGFAMMLSSDLVERWSFDENMMWWYGDDDVLKWTLANGRRTAILSFAKVSENCSWTVDNSRPAGFNEMVEQDKRIFYKKWGSDA